jgi:hypothetical protein
MIKIIKFILILIIFAYPTIGTTIDIYYPNNNTTTKIYYSENGSYNYAIGNNVSGNLSIVILNDELEYDNIIESPHKIISPLFKIILFVIILCIILIIIIAFKRIGL